MLISRIQRAEAAKDAVMTALAARGVTVIGSAKSHPCLRVTTQLTFDDVHVMHIKRAPDGFARLDVWKGKKKALSCLWYEGAKGTFDVITYRHGEFEDVAARLAA